MFKSILVPLDGSAFGEHALAAALGVARRTGARLDLVYVHAPPHSPDLYIPALSDAERRVKERAGAYLDGVARRVAAATGVVARATVLEGRVADRICGFAEGEGVDLVVMATHGRGALSRFWLGGVATELAQRSPAPLLLIRPREGPPDLAAEFEPRRILVPLDGSAIAEQAIPLATGLGALTGADVRLLRVVPPVMMGGWDNPWEPGGSVAEALQAEARSYLDEVARRFPLIATATRRVATDWPTAGTILADAEANGVDLIVLATHGRGGLERLVLGSVADKVVRGATIPVLLLRPVSG